MRGIATSKKPPRPCDVYCCSPTDAQDEHGTQPFGHTRYLSSSGLPTKCPWRLHEVSRCTDVPCRSPLRPLAVAYRRSRLDGPYVYAAGIQWLDRRSLAIGPPVWTAVRTGGQELPSAVRTGGQELPSGRRQLCLVPTQDVTMHVTTLLIPQRSPEHTARIFFASCCTTRHGNAQIARSPRSGTRFCCCRLEGL